MQCEATKVALYLRVSTDEQSPENQRLVLQPFCQQRGWEIVAVYQEEATAWKAGHQRELARLLEDCRHPRSRPDIVLVWALDRLTRQGAAAILGLVHTFRRYGVKVISYQESWTELPGELEDVLYAIIGWVAQTESKRRSERTKAGLLRARAAGKRLGRPPGSCDKCRRKRSARGHARPFEPVAEK